MIEIRQLGKEYRKTVALREFDLEVGSGELCGLVGPNGAGKSTLIKVLGTVTHPSSGTAVVGGYDVAEHPRSVREITGYMPDQPGLYQDMEVRELLRFFAEAFRLRGAAKRSAVDRALSWSGLADRASVPVEQLSFGQRQRLFLAKTLLHGPQLLLLDEPATGLDPLARIELRRQLKELHAEGVTLLVSSHILADLEDICTRIVFIAGGRNVSGAGAPESSPEPPPPPDALYLLQVEGDAEAAASVAAQLPGVRVAGSSAEGVLLGLQQGAVTGPELLRHLIQAGVAVARFEPRPADLESRYREMFRSGNA